MDYKQLLEVLVKGVRDTFIVYIIIIITFAVIIGKTGTIDSRVLVFLALIAILTHLVKTDPLKVGKNKIKPTDPIAKPNAVTPANTGRYLIGIDLGSASINYLLLDYEKFSLNPGDNFEEYCDYHVARKTPTKMNKIIEDTAHAIELVVEHAINNHHVPIAGIGIGLPGWVKPKDGSIIKGCGSFVTTTNTCQLNEL